jgi:CDP-diacylglycerol---glycerol-3-phosphate 3-phosphatidyltransferase
MNMFAYFETLDPIWFSLGPLIAVNGLALITVLMFIPIYKLRPTDHFSDKEHTRFLNKWFKEYWLWLTSPLEKLALFLGLKPNTLTFIGFLIAVAAAYCFHLGWIGLAGWVMILGATFDMLDGRIARQTGQSSESGAFFDSVMDRFGESIIYIGIASYFYDSLMMYVVLMVLTGSMMVSYTRARGQGVGVDCNKGSMQRPERTVYLAVSSIFAPMFDRFFAFIPLWPDLLLFTAALIFMAIMSNATAIYRLAYILRKLDEEK